MPASCPPGRFVESGTYVGYSRPLECAVPRAIVCERRKRTGSWRGCGQRRRGARRDADLAGRGRGPGHSCRRDRAATSRQGRDRRAVRTEPVRQVDDQPRARLCQPAGRLLSVFRERLLWRRLHARGRLPSVLRPRSGVGGQGALLDQELQADRVRDARAVELQRPSDEGYPRRLPGRATGRLLRDWAGLGSRTIAPTSASRPATWPAISPSGRRRGHDSTSK